MEELFIPRPKSGLLIPKGLDVRSADEKIADDYERDAITQAVAFMPFMSAREIASFLGTKAHSADIIRNNYGRVC